MSQPLEPELYTTLRAGTVLADKYRVERTIGVGGFGVVLAAMHLHLEERVAIKLLLPEAAANHEASQRFIREAKAAVKIKSEHVAKVTDVGVLPNGLPYMVMEYLEGYDLSKLVKQRGPQPIPEVIEWVLQAGEALSEAHAAGIVHRDLKPANLFLTWRADGTPSVKLLDFGISKVTAAHAADKGMTKTSDVMGSPYYMSPEQMKSTRNADARSDIWALGTILFEMVGGHPPFDGETMPALLAAILQEPPRDLTQLRPDVPRELQAVIFKCLEKDPAARFQNVGELAVALAPFAPPRAHSSVQRIVTVSSGAGRPHSAPLASTPPTAPSSISSSNPGSSNPSRGGLLPPSGTTEPGTGPPVGAVMGVAQTASSSSPIVAADPRVGAPAWGATVGASRGGRPRAAVLLAVGLGGVLALGAVGVLVVAPRLGAGASTSDAEPSAPREPEAAPDLAEAERPARGGPTPAGSSEPEITAGGDPAPAPTSEPSVAAQASAPKPADGPPTKTATAAAVSIPAGTKLGGGKLGGGKATEDTKPPPPPPPNPGDLFGSQD